MIKSLQKIILLFIVSSSLIYAQELKELTINVSAKNMLADSNVFISGNNPLMGNWDPSLVKLKKTSDNFWFGKFKLPAGFTVEFKFTRGSWENERIVNGNVPGNIIIKLQSDTTLNFVVDQWRDQVEIPTIGQVTGKVEYIKGLSFDGIKSRDVIVWLPPGYEINTAERYPVLYMHDGQNVFDPSTSFNGHDWGVDEVADSLIKDDKIENIIVVGIYNTDDRSDDYSPGAKGYAYEKFIVKKLKPLIDKKYRTKPGRENTAVAGSSMGGLISFMLAWEYPGVFSKAACISPAFHIGEYNYVKTVSAYNGEKKPIKIYIDNGGVGLEERLQPGLDEMLALLKRKGYVEREDLEYFKDSTAEHNEQGWAKRVWRPLEFLFGK